MIDADFVILAVMALFIVAAVPTVAVMRQSRPMRRH